MIFAFFYFNKTNNFGLWFHVTFDFGIFNKKFELLTNNFKVMSILNTFAAENANIWINKFPAQKYVAS